MSLEYVTNWFKVSTEDTWIIQVFLVVKDIDSQCACFVNLAAFGSSSFSTQTLEIPDSIAFESIPTPLSR